MDTKVLNILRPKLTYPSENWERLVWLWKNDLPISFYSWECPPRQIVNDPKLGRWVNLDVDIKSVVNGKALDEYTEIPRLVVKSNQEGEFINSVVKIYPRATYTKIIADTNGLYLYPKTKQILGEAKLRKLSAKFKSLLEEKAQKLYGKDTPSVVLYTKLQARFKDEYDFFFNFVYADLNQSEPKIIPDKILSHWINRVKSHVGLPKKDQEQKIEITKRVIASYAAEGIVFELLNQLVVLPNPVWANWEEPPLNGETTEILRQRYGLTPIPKIYFVEKK